MTIPSERVVDINKREIDDHSIREGLNMNMDYFFERK